MLFLHQYFLHSFFFMISEYVKVLLVYDCPATVKFPKILYLGVCFTMTYPVNIIKSDCNNTGTTWEDGSSMGFLFHRFSPTIAFWASHPLLKASVCWVPSPRCPPLPGATCFRHSLQQSVIERALDLCVVRTLLSFLCSFFYSELRQVSIQEKK